MKSLLLTSIISFKCILAFGQSGSTEIFLVKLMMKKDTVICSTPVNITNHIGYDNQPEFSFDSKKIFYVSMPDSTQSDIFEYSVTDSITTQLTTTAESEFSPKFPAKKNQISFVRVDADKGQRLYRSSPEFTDAEDMIYGLDSIGYYAWLNDSLIALATLNNGLELLIYELNAGQYVLLDKGIGRCLMKIPGTGDLVYTKKSSGKVTLFRYSVSDESVTRYCEGLGDAEDYAFTPDGNLLTSNDGKLFMCHPETNPGWKEIADFSKSAGTFYRMAVSPDGKLLAIVTYKGKRP